MANTGDLTVQVIADQDDVDALAEITGRLRSELLDLDVESVDAVDESTAPDGAKGLGTLVGWLVVQVGAANVLRAVVGTVRAWAARTNRSVEVSVGDDVLKITGATSEQQEKIVDAWLARHAPSA